MHYAHHSKVKHKELLELIDLRLLELFYHCADKHDKARIQCLSNNGATSWLDVVPTDQYGVKFDNQEMWVLLSLFFGCDIINCDKLTWNEGNGNCRKGNPPWDYGGKYKWKIERKNILFL